MRDTNDLKRDPFIAKVLNTNEGLVYVNPKEAFPDNSYSSESTGNHYLNIFPTKKNNFFVRSKKFINSIRVKS